MCIRDRCGAEAVREEGEAAVRCTGIECPAKLFRNLVHFVSREAMNIDGLGENIIAQLLERELIHNISDIYLSLIHIWKSCTTNFICLQRLWI